MADLLAIADQIVRGGVCDKARRSSAVRLSDLFGGAGVMIFRQCGPVVEDLEHAAWPDESVARCTGPLADPRANGMLEQMPFVPLGVPLRPEAEAPEDWHRSAIFREGMAPFGLLHPLGGLLARTSRDFSSVSIMKRASGGPATRKDAALLAALMPALATADRMRRLLVEAMAEREMLAAALDALARPVTVVDGNARVRYANAASQDAFDRGDWLQLRAGVVRPTGVKAQERFSQTLRRATQTVGAVAGATMPREDASASATRVEPLPVGVYGDEPLALLVGALSVDPSETMLQEAYGLTRAEARLGKLLIQGLPLSVAAMKLGRSINTVKTEARSLYAKLGVRRQTEAVAKILPELG